MSTASGSNLLTSSENGTVLVSYGSHGVVRCTDGQQLDCQYRRQVGRPFCGDYVRIKVQDDGSGVVEAIHERRNHFVRADPQQRQHIIAANLDRVLIVIAPSPLPSRDLVERYLVATHSLGIEPVIVLNKVDMTDWDRTHAGAAAMERTEFYRQLGYTVAQTSCKSEPGIRELAPLLNQGTSILVGQSGVGKSSLAHEILPEIEIITGELSTSTGKGTHTTTTTILYPLPQGGALVDSPGVWEYGLWLLDDAEIGQGYREFRPFLGACRFNDCKHLTEPACAIKKAVDAGDISQWRYESYCRLLEQNKQGSRLA